jgi:hypothetical protein
LYRVALSFIAFSSNLIEASNANRERRSMVVMAMGKSVFMLGFRCLVVMLRFQSGSAGR